MSAAAFNPGLRAELARSVDAAAPLWTFANATTNLWWDFSDSSTITAGLLSYISGISDKSGSGNNGSQSTASNQPYLVTSAHNGLDCARFSHTAANFLNFASELDQIRTVFWVLSRNSNLTGHAHNRALLGHGTSYDWHATASGIISTWAASQVKNGTFKLDGTGVDGSSTLIPVDLAVASIVTTDYAEADNFAKDRSYSTSQYRNWGGDLCELCIIESAWSTADIQKGEGYLAHKWGLAGNLPSDHPYKSEAPTQ